MFAASFLLESRSVLRCFHQSSERDNVRDLSILTRGLLTGAILFTAQTAWADDGSIGIADLAQHASRFAHTEGETTVANAQSAPAMDGWVTAVSKEPELQPPAQLAAPPAPKPARKPKAAARAKSGHLLSGIASYYWQDQMTASGERFNKNELTAAHKTLPFNTKVRVSCKSTGREVVVRINDRGPFIPGRVIDLSEAAAEALGMRGKGLTPVHLEVVSR